MIETVFFAQPLEYAQHSIFEGLGRNGLVDGGLKSRLEDAGEVWNEQAGEKDRSDDSGGKALDEPVDLPGPALDRPERYEIGSRGQSSNPVVDHSDKRVWAQITPRPLKIGSSNRTQTTSTS